MDVIVDVDVETLPVTFESFDLDTRIMQALAKMGIFKPTLIQESAIPLALAGKDIVARARTGSGKTAAYCLPILNTLLKSDKAGVRAVILVPTKELASQVKEFLMSLIVFCPASAHIHNLVDFDTNTRVNTEQTNQILVATPSKLTQHLKSSLFSLDPSLEFIVLDEADLILSFGYQCDIESIQTFMPRIYQSFFMSATLTPELENLKKLIVRNPAIIKLEDGDDNDLLTQYFVSCSDKDKYLVLFFILKLKVHPFGDAKTIIFVNDIDQCYRIKLFFEQFGIRACVLNSELPLVSRLHIVDEFNRGTYDYVIATDQGDELGQERDSEDDTFERKEATGKSKNVKKGRKQKADKEYGSSRGLDFKNVQAVINFNLPTTSRSYMHRVGRTARGLGNEGFALSFVMSDSVDKVKIKTRLNEDGSAMSRDEYMMKRIEKKQIAMGREIKQFKFDMAYIEGFRYRTDDALRAVTKIAIRDARVKEIKSEIINSEKLKSHFEDNPKDLEALKHDKVLHPARVQPHMRHIPSYLVPKKGSTGNKVTMAEDGEAGLKRKRFNSKPQGKAFKKNDPLKSFKA